MPITALLIDDSEASRKLIGAELRQIGCAVVGEATKAADGLKLFTKLRPNLVTLDLMMPTKDNVGPLVLVRKIKNEDPKTAIIVVSVVQSGKIAGSFAVEGVLAYVNKPFNNCALESLRLNLRRIFPELGEVGW
jgi:two-component system chemotaxis response regulator CheY